MSRRTASGVANCPVCGRRSYYRQSYSYYPPAAPQIRAERGSTATGGTSGSARGRGTLSYTPAERRTLEPFRLQAEKQAKVHPDRRDLFLCHAWDDRNGCATELYDLLVANGAAVWFSEKDVTLGTSLLREIDKGLRNSRVGIVLVTPALLKSLEAEGIADKELSALLATDRVIPIAHGTTFADLRNVSPLLAARSGLDAAESSMSDVAAKVASAARAQELA